MNNFSDGYYMMDGDGYMHGGVWGWLFMLVLLVAAIVATVAAIRYLSNNRGQVDRQETALDVLNKRYARGEISKKEYQELKQDITIGSARDKK
jgi:putative membrane protein